MLSSTRLRDFSARRLRYLLLALFVALSVPTAALVWQAWSQLKWEAFHQYRLMAEELGNRIDADLAERIALAEERSFGDFSFLVVSGDPSANLLQRSPLSAFPVPQDLPGVIGYFQVDADGVFTTPLLPPPGSATRLGVPEDELESRRLLASRISSVLADNQLVRQRPVNRAPAGLVVTSSLVEEESVPYSSEAAKEQRALVDDAERQLAESVDAPQSDGDAMRQFAGGEFDTQQAFEKLNNAPSAMAPAEGVAAGKSRQATKQDEYAKLADLKLDASLEKKTEASRDKRAQDAAAELAVTSAAANRVRRLEQAALPQSPSPDEMADSAETVAVASAVSAPITTFASEIDPYEFSLLDSGHLVLFRKVWRNDERLVQGILLDTTEFLAAAIESEYRATSLSGMSDLTVAWQDNILATMRGGSSTRYSSGPDDLRGTLLYRATPSAPFDRLDLVFSINRLPPGPGATVLAWTSIVIAAVFIAGFLLLYRLGMSQIRLARQQQDFVSAVSHELKTPLTSIRMYGEMLMEGWVSEDKRKQYYAYIHDESERLTRLISNVLQLAKITRSRPALELHARSMATLLDLVQSKIASQVERAGFKLVILADERAGQTRVNIDEDSFAQIVINLVDNAIKFSKHADNKTVEISGRVSTDGTVTFSVRDFGPGIARDQMKKIFQLFYRSESELTRETVGTGIGLAIVHQLTLAMNGKVDVVNRDPGAEFRLAFPAIPDSAG